jgi:hypothetical protein
MRQVLLSNGDSTSEEIKRDEQLCFSKGRKLKVLNSGVSASGRKSEVLNSGVSASDKVESAEQWCFSIMKKIKHAEQWCFSIVKKNDEGLLTMVFQQRKKKRRNNCWTKLFRQ